MHDVTLQLKDKAIAATMAYKNQLLDDFLANKINFQIDIDYLLEYGESADGNLCLDDEHAKPFGKTVLFKREDIENVKHKLATINEENAVEVFNWINQTTPYFAIFSSFNNMQILATKISTCTELSENLNS